MLTKIEPPRADTKQQPLRPGVIYTQRGREFARIMQGARR